MKTHTNKSTEQGTLTTDCVCQYSPDFNQDQQKNHIIVFQDVRIGRN